MASNRRSTTDNSPSQIHRGRVRLAAAGLVASLGLAACSPFLPQSGPTTSDILSSDPDQTLDYAIVQLDTTAIAAKNGPKQAAFDLDFRSVGPQNPGVVGVGDVLEVSVWENVEDGLFTSLGAKQSVIPKVLVNHAGYVSIPYIGRVKAAGRKMVEIQESIKEKLATQTLRPEIMVVRSEAAARAVAVQGAVNKPGLYPLVLHQDRLIPVLAAAGGARGEPSLMEVSVQRGDATTTGWLDTVYDDPTANLAMRSGDSVIVTARQLSFNAFGATRQSGRVPFPRRELSLLEALATVGGLNTQTANPTGIFVFRSEDPGLVNNLNRVDDPSEEDLARFGDEMPVVYQLELNRSEAMFVANAFMLEDGDTIYVTEAPYAAWRKVLSVVIPALGTAGSVNSLYQATQ